MKTAGQILSSTRKEQRLDIADISRVTKIRASFLEAIELDNYSKLPSGATTRGFIRNYSEYLGLSPEHILAVFRRDFVESPTGEIVPRGVADPVIKKNFWTPKTSIFAAVVFIFTLFGAYLIYQYRILTGPPPLHLDTPAENITVVADTIDISGNTDPEATISVNNQLVALEKGGTFSLRFPVTKGSNKIIIVATSKSGKTSAITREVTRLDQ